MIERLICKTIQSIFLFITLKTLRKILSIARKLYITTGSFLNRESKVKIEIENPSQNRKSNSKSDIKVEIENRNRKSTTIEKIENRKSKIDNRKSKIDNRKSKIEKKISVSQSFDFFCQRVSFQTHYQPCSYDAY